MKSVDVLGLHEYQNTAAGLKAVDTMVKAAPVSIVDVRTVNPGKYVVLVTGDVASVEVALRAARQSSGDFLLGELFLQNLHADVIPALGRANAPDEWEALAIVETATIASGIRCADSAAKRTSVRIAAIRIDDSMGGRASVRMTGALGEIETAIESVVPGLENQGVLVHAAIIPRLSTELQRFVYDGSYRQDDDPGIAE